MSEELEVGDFLDGTVDTTPDTQSQRVDRYGIDAIALKAQERPHKSILAAKEIPIKYTNSLRTRKRDPYLTEDGEIKVSIKSCKKKNEKGEKLVDCYLTWVPFPDISHNINR